MVEVNETVVDVDTTWLRQDDDYIRYGMGKLTLFNCVAELFGERELFRAAGPSYQIILQRRGYSTSTKCPSAPHSVFL